jgi:acyl transferase domain-containing protein
MPLKNVFMFSGQGSHYFQMGRMLYEEHPVFRRWMTSMDATVRDISGLSVIDELYRPERRKADDFGDIRLSHPAIFMVEYALAQTLIDADVQPDVVLGASLGMFVASALAGCVRPEAALAATVNQANLLHRHCPAGAMIAVLGSVALYEQLGLAAYCELAGINFDEHFVIATVPAHLPKVESLLRGRTSQRLMVAYPFHSKWIEPVRRLIEDSMHSLQPRPARIPIACCARSVLLQTLPPDHFWHTVREPIRFQQTLQTLERHERYRYFDVGPAGTLATFAKYALGKESHARVHSVLSPFGRDSENLAAAVGAAVG